MSVELCAVRAVSRFYVSLYVRNKNTWKRFTPSSFSFLFTLFNLFVVRGARCVLDCY